MHTKKLFL